VSNIVQTEVKKEMAILAGNITETNCRIDSLRTILYQHIDRLAAEIDKTKVDDVSVRRSVETANSRIDRVMNTLANDKLQEELAKVDRRVTVIRDSQHRYLDEQKKTLDNTLLRLDQQEARLAKVVEILNKKSDPTSVANFMFCLDEQRKELRKLADDVHSLKGEIARQWDTGCLGARIKECEKAADRLADLEKMCRELDKITHEQLDGMKTAINGQEFRSIDARCIVADLARSVKKLEERVAQWGEEQSLLNDSVERRLSGIIEAQMEQIKNLKSHTDWLNSIQQRVNGNEGALEVAKRITDAHEERFSEQYGIIDKHTGQLAALIPAQGNHLATIDKRLEDINKWQNSETTQIDELYALFRTVCRNITSVRQMNCDLERRLERAERSWVRKIIDWWRGPQ